MKLPNIVQGNDFKMAVNVYTIEVIEGEEIKKDFDVSTSTDIKVYLVKSNNANGCIDKYEVPFEISEEASNVIYIIIKGINLPLGSYGLEITGVDQYEYHWRFKAKIGELFNIVDATSASSYDNSTYIDFDASIGVIGNNLISEIEDIVTIMFDNLIGDVEGEIEDIKKDVENKANKNDLASVATTGNYDDLINKPNLFSGDYNDLSNKPIIPTVPTNVSAFINDAGYLTEHQDLSAYALKTDLFSGDYNDLTNKPTLFSGNYNDLTNKPTNVSAFINDAGYLTEHQSLVNYVQFNDLASVATTGDYNDLTNKPTIPTVPTNVSAFTNDAGYLTEHQDLSAYALKTDLFSGDYNDLTNKPTLFSGDYNDLTNKPIIPTVPTNVSAFTNDAGYLTEHQSLVNYVQFNDLASVATSGDYDDLSNKPTLFSGNYNDLTNKPTIPTVPTNVSAFINDAGYLTEHQSLANYVQFTDLATVATSGDYNDLSNKPTIPVIPTNVSAFTNDAGYINQIKTINNQSLIGEGNIDIQSGGVSVQSDWNQTDSTAADYIKNKPTIPTVPTNVSAFTNDAGYLTQHQSLANYVQFTDLATVATSGDYDDLTNKPTLFSGNYNDLTNKPTIPTVPTNVSAFTNDAGYLTEHQDLSAYALKTDLFSGDYNDLTNKPTLFSGNYNDLSNKPTNVSSFTNDAKYVASTTSGLKIEVVSAMPANPQNNVLYIVQ